MVGDFLLDCLLESDPWEYAFVARVLLLMIKNYPFGYDTPKWFGGINAPKCFWPLDLVD